MRSTFIVLYALVIALTGCDQAHYRNPAHPEYGSAEFSKDNKECQDQNSQTYTVAAAYAEQTHTVVDDDKAQACLAARGWQRVAN